jgi:hypothetical protein
LSPYPGWLVGSTPFLDNASSMVAGRGAGGFCCDGTAPAAAVAGTGAVGFCAVPAAAAGKGASGFCCDDGSATLLRSMGAPVAAATRAPTDRPYSGPLVFLKPPPAAALEEATGGEPATVLPPLDADGAVCAALLPPLADGAVCASESPERPPLIAFLPGRASFGTAYRRRAIV